MVPATRLIRVLLVPLLGAVLVLSGCSRGSDTAQAALYNYVEAVNARDRGALERLFADEDDPSAWADWVLAHAPSEKMGFRKYRIEMVGVLPYPDRAVVKWNQNGGVPKDGRFILRPHETVAPGIGPWTLGFANEGPGETPSPFPRKRELPPPKPSRSPTRELGLTPLGGHP
ncbi:MAG: nuclear transport factor 2 family protein [Candidatus Nanopelagicales bacterium]|nr:nuclear transport factor 2 family protein [Candidatus Nanopelagicales bacterium]